MNLEKLVQTRFAVTDAFRSGFSALQLQILKVENYHHCVCAVESMDPSRTPIAPVKPAALCSFGSKERGNQFKSSVFKKADVSNLGRSLLEGNTDHQAKSELTRQELQVSQ